MRKKIIFSLIVFLIIQVLNVLEVRAASEGKVALMPFTIYSQENLDYLQKNILEALSGGLSKQRIPLIPLTKTQPWVGQKIPREWMELRAIGKELGADWIIYGSLTKIGQRLSLTGNLLETKTDKFPLSFSMTEEGLENILKLIERFSKEVGLRILGQEKIAGISIKGNQRIEAPAIERELKSKTGEAYNPELLNQDLRAIFKMGFFSDVQMEEKQTPQGKSITFVVVERPFVKRIDLKGNKELKYDDLKDQLTVKSYTILNLNTVNESLEKLMTFYQSKGFYNVQITYSITYEDKGQAGVVVYNIVEGKKVYIKTINFQGNKGFSEKQLKALMETNEKDYLYWITSSGVYKKELLEQDLEKLSSFYYNHGYLKAKVGEPTVRHEGEWLYIAIPIEEGQQYKMGQVGISGDLIQPKEKLMGSLAIAKEKFYNREVIRKDVMMLSDLYSFDGYAFVEISPQTKEDPSVPKVDIVYEIKKGSKVYFERIDIVGNVKTRDRVIRREFKVAEKGLFDAKALRRSNELLHRLDFFDEINISTSPGSQEDRMNLKLEVKEKPTGSFSLGFGYSQIDQFMIMGQVAQRNLFGLGERLSFSGMLGFISSRYQLSFLEPRVFDSQLSFESTVYSMGFIYNQYTKDSYGTTQTFGYPFLGDYTRAYITYTYDSAHVYNVQDGSALVIQSMAGQHSTSSVRFTLRRDSRDQIFNPTKGSINSASVEYAGGPLMGTNSFTRYIVSSGWYFPFIGETTLFVNGKWGLVSQNAGGDLPLYEKFYLGGINSIRGFKLWSIGPTDPATGQVIGGEQMVQFNFEYIFPMPVYAKAGLKGLVFFDAGNSFNGTLDTGDLRKSVGLGVRWYSPMGPLRLEWGWNLAPRPGENNSNWDFTMGTIF